jgi:hypothetical protein
MSLREIFQTSTIQLLNRVEKKILRDYFNIKSITQARKGEGYDNVEEYYLFLKTKKENTDEELKNNKADEKKKLKKKRNKQNKKLKQKEEEKKSEVEEITAENGSDSGESDGTHDIERSKYKQFKPEIYFSKRLKGYSKKQEIINLLNSLYDENENYKLFLYENKYDLIKIVKEIHTGYYDPLHFNGFFKSFSQQDSKTYHFYINDNKITQLSQIYILNL